MYIFHRAIHKNSRGLSLSHEQYKHERQHVQFQFTFGFNENPGSPSDSTDPKRIYALFVNVSWLWLTYSPTEVHAPALAYAVNDRPRQPSVVPRRLYILQDTYFFNCSRLREAIFWQQKTSMSFHYPILMHRNQIMAQKVLTDGAEAVLARSQLRGSLLSVPQP